MSEISVKTQGQKVLTTWRHLGNETVNLTNANTNATPTIKFCVSKTSTRYCTCRQLQCAVFLTLQLQWIVCIKAKQNRIPEQAAMLDGITKQKVNKSFMTLYFSYLLIVSCWLKKCWHCEVWWNWLKSRTKPIDYCQTRTPMPRQPPSFAFPKRRHGIVLVVNYNVLCSWVCNCSRSCALKQSKTGFQSRQPCWMELQNKRSINHLWLYIFHICLLYLAG